MSIRVIAAGGTFDKLYDPIQGQLVFGDSQLPAVLERARIGVPVSFEPLPLLDSLDMVDSDRQRILDACRNAAEQRIVIVHGTDTMAETAQVLNAAQLDKTIVLTGAMVPTVLPLRMPCSISALPLASSRPCPRGCTSA